MDALTAAQESAKKSKNLNATNDAYLIKHTEEVDEVEIIGVAKKKASEKYSMKRPFRDLTDPEEQSGFQWGDSHTNRRKKRRRSNEDDGDGNAEDEDIELDS